MLRYQARLTLPAAGYAAAYPAYAPGAVPRRPDPHTLHTLAGRSMGTAWRVRLGNPGMRPLDEARQVVEECLARVVRQMSHWEPDSDLARFGRAPAGTWHVLAPE